jgi:predicted Zn-dependent protease
MSRCWVVVVLAALSSIGSACASDSSDASAAKFQSIIDRDPGSFHAWSHLGVLRMQQGRLDEACRAFKHALKLNSHDSAIQADLGVCYFEQQKYSAAIPPFERAEKLNPGNSNVHAYLARCYEKVGRREDAEKERQSENLLQMDTFR